MKAMLCKEFGPIEALKLEDVPSPVAGPKQIVVRIAAAGVNFPDTLIVQGKYQMKPPFPFSPGGEFAGTVKAVGEGVSHVKPGDAVIGVGSHGGYAEEAVIDAAAAIPIPATIDPAIAATLMFAHGTTLHALKDRAALEAEESLLVLGAAGGVGLAAVELGKLMGAKVIAAASTPEKLAVCKRAGADELIDYTREDLRERIKDITGGRGVDVVYDAVGGPYSEPAIRSTAWNGRFLVIGFAAGTIPQIPLNLPLLKGMSIVGVFWGGFTQREPAKNRDNVRQLLEWVTAGKVAPHISARYPLSRAVDALKALLARQVTGKIVVIPRLMNQLNGTDAGFLEQEKGNVYLHVAGLAIYDPSTAPGGKVRFKDILRFFQSRIALDVARAYRRQLVTVPLSLDRPYWLEVDDIDIEFHVRHIALPQPGDWRQLMIQVARLHSRPLDRSRPLWEAYVIEGLDRIPGLPKGSFAVFTKIHHAVIDGQLGAAMLKHMHALTPAVKRERIPAATRSGDRRPRDVELIALAVVNNLTRARQLVGLTAEGAGNIGRMALERISKLIDAGAAAASGATSDAPGAGMKRPVTRFNAPVSASRVIEAVDFPLDGVKRIAAKVEGATLNDAYLAIVGGAVRKYLEDKNELPATTLNAMVPISVRERADQPGNQIALTLMDLRTEIADPLERLATVHRGAARSKKTTSALGKHLIKGLLDESPVVVSNWLTRNVVARLMNMTVSNVRGPDVPLYMSGAKLVRNYPVSAIADNVGLNVTAFSYNGVFSVCAVADRAMMPDPAFFADCLRTSYRELEKARRRK